MTHVRRNAELVASEFRQRFQLKGYTSRHELDASVDRLGVSQTESMMVRDSGNLRPHDNGWEVSLSIDDPPRRQLFTLAHEIGHLVFHYSPQPGIARRDIEAWCNYFASEVLLPAELIRGEFSGARRSLTTVNQLYQRSSGSFATSFLKLNTILGWKLELSCFMRQDSRWQLLAAYGDAAQSVAKALVADQATFFDPRADPPRICRVNLEPRHQVIVPVEIFAWNGMRFATVEYWRVPRRPILQETHKGASDRRIGLRVPTSWF